MIQFKKLEAVITTDYNFKLLLSPNTLYWYLYIILIYEIGQ